MQLKDRIRQFSETIKKEEKEEITMIILNDFAEELILKENPCLTGLVTLLEQVELEETTLRRDVEY